VRTASDPNSAITSKTRPLKVSFHFLNSSDLHLTVFGVALHFVTKFCCDCTVCSGDFDLQSFFPGKIFKEPEPSVKPKRVAKRNPDGTVTKPRPVADRALLRHLLVTWRSRTHQNDPLSAIMPVSWIMDDKQMKQLIAADRSLFKSSTAMGQILGKTSAWSEKYAKEIYNIIHLYDHPPVIPPLIIPPPSSRKRKAPELEEPTVHHCLVVRIPPRAPFQDKSNVIHETVIHQCGILL
jgi:hypothetical protein